jgi:hypothetical protein
MTELDVLLLESFPGAGRAEASQIVASGHRVHRCHDVGKPSFPCNGLTDSGCPLDDGVDVVVMARGRFEPDQTEHEHGASCAIRAQVPLVEAHHGVASPFEPWAVAQADGALIHAIEHAAEHSLDQLVDELLRIARPKVSRAGGDPDRVSCRIERHADGAHVVFHGPVISDVVKGKIGVRALDAVRQADRSIDVRGVSYVC